MKEIWNHHFLQFCKPLSSARISVRLIFTCWWRSLIQNIIYQFVCFLQNCYYKALHVICKCCPCFLTFFLKKKNKKTGSIFVRSSYIYGICSSSPLVLIDWLIYFIYLFIYFDSSLNQKELNAKNALKETTGEGRNKNLCTFRSRGKLPPAMKPV